MIGLKRRIDLLEKQWRGKREKFLSWGGNLTPEEKEAERQRAKIDPDHIYIELQWGEKE